MDELMKAVALLTTENSSECCNNSITTLLSSLGMEGELKEDCINAILESGVVKAVKSCLENRACSVEQAVQLVAEMAKTDALRQQCTSVGLISPLLQVMSTGNVGEMVQACRALGNICFDNDIARAEVCQQDGVARLLKLLRDQLDAELEQSGNLRKVACGFLFNLTNTHENLIDTALSMDVLRLLSDYIYKFSTNEDLLHMVLLAVGSLADSDTGRIKFLECGILRTISNLLTRETIAIELCETILDLFANLAEIDEMKLSLAASEIFDILLKLMASENFSAEDKTTVENVTSDLIVLILTGDESMKLLYDGGNGKIVAEAVKWMKSPSEHLQNSGALAIGNLARSDEHCIQLVKSGITSELLALLDRHPVEQGSSIIHHAVFSALRNLAIPAVCKPVMLQSQLLNRIMPYMDTPMSTVLFKLLGTLRMIIDGQESAAVSVGTDPVFMNKLTDWCVVEDHQGVRGEANRLVASLVKNSRSSDVMNSVVSCGGLKHLISLMTSEHVLMQNEAVFALTLLVSVLSGSIADQLVQVEMLQNVRTIVDNESTPVELLRNVVTLLTSSASHEVLNRQMVNLEFDRLLTKLQTHSDEQIRRGAANIRLGT